RSPSPGFIAMLTADLRRPQIRDETVDEDRDEGEGDREHRDEARCARSRGSGLVEVGDALGEQIDHRTEGLAGRDEPEQQRIAGTDDEDSDETGHALRDDRGSGRTQHWNGAEYGTDDDDHGDG